jgi:hypothetical protein
MKSLKSLLLLFAGLLMCIGVHAQNISNSEAFADAPGRILEKEMITIGALDVKYNFQRQSMNINALVMRDLMTDEVRSCLVFELIKKTKFAFIDPDEISLISNMIKLMEEQFINSMRTNYTELVVNTRGGTEAGCFIDEDKWIVFLRLDKSEENTIIEIRTEDLPKFSELLGKADKVIN